jgi:hypothetical protein
MKAVERLTLRAIFLGEKKLNKEYAEQLRLENRRTLYLVFSHS